LTDGRDAPRRQAGISEPLASFRELKGVGPAIEARLHAAGVLTWEALAQVAAALGSVRGAAGESLQDLSARIAEHATAAAQGQAAAAPARRPSRVRVAVLDAGKAIGGATRGIELDLATSQAGEVPVLVEYQATLSGRPFGQAEAEGPSAWMTLARQAGRVSGADRLPLRFPAVALPAGIHRLRVEVALRLPEPTEDAPKLALG
jgi:hypothetical protein